jgi:hypothetical protein
LPLDPRFAGSNLAEDDRFLRAINVRSTTFFGGEVKAPVPCKILPRVKEPYSYEKRYFVGKIHGYFISRKVSPDSLLDVFSSDCQRELEDESGMIGTQMGTHSRSNGRNAWDSLSDISP